MKPLSQIEELTASTLTSLDDMQPLEANAFLYSKIKHRMQQHRHNAAMQHTRLMFKLSAALLLFLCINISSYYLFNKWQQRGANTTKATTGINAVSEEYFPKTDAYNY